MSAKALAAGTCILAAAAALGLGASAQASFKELEALGTSGQVAPSCPANPCEVLAKTTGYQARVNTLRAPTAAPRAGRIVAWSLRLSQPNRAQVQFFDTNEGGEPSAQLAVLRPGPRLHYRLVSASPVVLLTPYLGKSPDFPLVTTLPVRRGDVVALTVPTWAPVLEIGLASSSAWRSSRPKRRCANTTSSSIDSSIGGVVQFACLYRTAGLAYAATLISTP